MRSWPLAAGLLVGVLAALPAADAPAEDVTTVPVRVPGNVFDDAESEFTLRVESKKAATGRLVWAFKIDSATVAAREAAWTAGPDKPAAVSFKFTVPRVKDGVVLKARLGVAAYEVGQAKPVAQFEKDVWIFPKDPFVDRGEWLKGLKIRLYDPAKATAKALAGLNVPLEEVVNVAALGDLSDGVLVVGEGVSLKEEPGLSDALAACAAAGVRVLCLAPAGGDLAVPGLGRPTAGLRDLAFRRDAVRTLDKRLDPTGWPPDGKAVAATFRVRPADNGVAAEAAPADDGWPWIEARAEKGPGRWAACGYAIVAHWDAGPTPRFLFARVLEHLTDSNETKPAAKEKP